MAARIKTKRILELDAFRGIAVLVMTVLHIFTYLARFDIYSDAPIYIAEFNMPFILAPPLLFTFIAGIGVYLAVSRRLKKGLKSPQILKILIKRYGFYILLSLPFAAYVFGFQTWLKWDEAIQGIGLTAIFTAAALLLSRSPLYLIGLILAISFARPMATVFSTSDFSSITSAAATLAANALFNGWFSVANLFPMIAGGALLASLFLAKKAGATKFLMIGLAFLAASLVLHLAGFKIDYYNKSSAFSLFSVGAGFLVFSAILFAAKGLPKIAGKISPPLVVFGKNALVIYIGQFVLLIKTVELLGLKDTLPNEVALALTIPLTLAFYFFGGFYSAIKAKLKLGWASSQGRTR